MTITRIEPNGRRSLVVVHGGIAYVAGQTADDRTGDIRAQTAETLAKIEAALTRVGAHRSGLLTAQIWLADMADFEGMNAIWDAWAAGAEPARACAQVTLAHPDIRVEIVVSAAI